MMITHNNSKIDQVALLHEQVKSLYQGWKSLIAGCVFVMLMTTLALWNTIELPVLVTWAFLYSCFLLTRALSLSKAVARQNTTGAAFGESSINQYRWYSLVNSLFWGAVPLILFNDSFPAFSVAMLIHCGYIAGAVSVTASYDLKSYYAFVYPSSFLWALGAWINGGPEFLTHIFLFTFYPFLMTVFAQRMHTAFKTQIILHLTNAELNRNLTEQRDKAEQAMLDKNRFLAAASHDLRQPVHALGLFIASLEPFLDKKEPKKLLGQIKRTSDNLGSLFHSLLDLSKLDANVIAVNPQHFRLYPMIDTLCDEYVETAEQKEVALTNACKRTLYCHADPALLEQILRNLISNAINYTHSGQVIVKAELILDRVKIECIDTGIGIPESEQQNIFSEYHQLENPERDRKKGLGLGLAIVRRIADLMAVDITVESKPGHGSNFSVEVPKGNQSQASPIEHNPEIKTREIAAHVLVVDDEEEILMGMKSLLLSWGCSVTTATSGQQALERLNPGNRPDLILADFRLRNHESGLHVIQRVRDEFNDDELPAFLITGDTAPERLKQATAAQVELWHKPVDPAKLRTSLIGRFRESHPNPRQPLDEPICDI